MSDKSDRSDRSDKSDGLFTSHGGYRRLRSFQAAETVYDGTLVFCGRFIDRRSRTHDQMVQAARSGRQNIAEGSMASATSKKMEIKLTNVAKASLEELLLDCEDYLRQHGLRLRHVPGHHVAGEQRRVRFGPGPRSVPASRVHECGQAQGARRRTDLSGALPDRPTLRRHCLHGGICDGRGPMAYDRASDQRLPTDVPGLDASGRTTATPVT